MIFEINSIPIYFPYASIHPSEIEYITTMLIQFQKKNHFIIEIPSEVYRTLALLSSAVSYSIYCKNNGRPYKIIYCVRDDSDTSSIISNLKVLIAYINNITSTKFIGIELPINNIFDMWDVYENINIDVSNKFILDNFVGVYTFNEMLEFSQKNNIHWLTMFQTTLHHCDFVVFAYNYLLDPGLYSIVYHSLQSTANVIFENGWDIDHQCTKIINLKITRPLLESAYQSLEWLEMTLDRNESMLSDIFLKSQKVHGIGKNEIPYYANNLNSPFYYEYIPGNMRSSIHTVKLFKRLIEFLKIKLKVQQPYTMSLKEFINEMADLVFIDAHSLKFCSQRLGIVLRDLHVAQTDMCNLKIVSRFATLIAIYSDGFQMAFNHYTEYNTQYTPIIQLFCIDPSKVLQPIFSKFHTVMITVGALVFSDIYLKILGIKINHAYILKSDDKKNNIASLIITKGDDQILLENKVIYKACESNNMLNTQCKTSLSTIITDSTINIDSSIIRNYGNLILNLSKVVPDNIIVIFPSYFHINKIINEWDETGFIRNLLENKLIFVETTNYKEKTIIMQNFKIACDNGRGAILFSTFENKNLEELDFLHGYNRSLVVIGVPYIWTINFCLQCKLQYFKTEYNINEYDFIHFDIIRTISQYLNMMFKRKDDYSSVIFVDFYFFQQLSNFPQWVQQKIPSSHTELSVEMGTCIIKQFFREIRNLVKNIDLNMVDEVEAIKLLNNK